MTPEERRRRLKELDGDDPRAVSASPQPRPPEWLLHKILESCQGQPDAMLTDWLTAHQVYANDIAQWRAEIQSPHWRDTRAVAAAAAALDGHPMAGYLGKMLHALVGRHAPDNVGWIPPCFHPTQEMK